MEDINRLFAENIRLSKGGSLKIWLDFINLHEKDIKVLSEYSADISEISNTLIKNKEYIDLIGLNQNKLSNLSSIKDTALYTLSLREILEKVEYFAKDNLRLLSYFKESYQKDIENLDHYINSEKSFRFLSLETLIKI